MWGKQIAHTRRKIKFHLAWIGEVGGAKRKITRKNIQQISEELSAHHSGILNGDLERVGALLK